MPRRRQNTIKVELMLNGILATRNGARLRYSFNVPNSITIGHVVAMLRRTISIKESEAIFIFHKDSLAPMSTMCSALAINKQLDLTASIENAFGGFESLPPDLQALIHDFLIPSKKQVRASMGYVMADIRCYGDIKYPPDRYSVREVVDFINDYCQSKVRYQY